MYYMATGPYSKLFEGTEYKIDYDYENESADGPKAVVEENLKNMTFLNTISFNSYFELTFKNEFKGLKAKL